MAQYKVIGTDETVENVDVRGVIHRPGDVVELATEDAAELVETGVLVLVGDEGAGAPAGASAPAPAGETTPPAADTTPPVDNPPTGNPA